MKYIVQITSGRGPAECCWVVAQLARYLINEMARHNFHAELTDAVSAKSSNTLSSAIIIVSNAGASIMGLNVATRRMCSAALGLR